MKLSVTLITLNEEANIRQALESARWADEIVVVDAFSTDRTVAICREYTDRVFQHPWSGFAAQKNLALREARGEWVFSLDADERIPPSLAEEIRRVVADDGPCDGYFVPRKNYFAGRWIRHGGWYPDHTLRLFRRSKGRFLPRAVHEAVQIQDGRVGYLRHALEHYTYASVSDYLTRMDRYSTLAAQEMACQGRRARIADLVLRPPAVFLKAYVLRGGFLDGLDGLVLAGLGAAYAFAKYAKLREIQARDGEAPASP